jgi:ABC-type anion transport system duplicated permease subunit
VFLFSLYSKLHWRVLQFHYQDMTEDLRRPLVQVLNSLEFYRVVALLALAFLIWAFRGRPRWLAWIALPPAVLALYTAATVQ